MILLISSYENLKSQEKVHEGASLWQDFFPPLVITLLPPPQVCFFEEGVKKPCLQVTTECIGNTGVKKGATIPAFMECIGR